MVLRAVARQQEADKKLEIESKKKVGRVHEHEREKFQMELEEATGRKQQQREAHEAHKAGIRTMFVAYKAEIRTMLYNDQGNVAQHKPGWGVSKGGFETILEKMTALQEQPHELECYELGYRSSFSFS